MHHRFSIAILALALCTASPGEETWKPLWNGKDLSAWSTWMQRPERNSEVPGMQRGPDGKYLEIIGSDRDPLKVFTVVEADGLPAIRISGEVFCELRSRESFQNHHLRLQFDGVIPVPVTSGPIILQSEGAETFYRNIEFKPITAMPAEFAG